MKNAIFDFSNVFHHLKGIKAKGSTFIEIWSSIFKNIHALRITDTFMGISCIIILLLMRLLVTTKIGPKNDDMKSSFHKIINKIIWLVGTARNAILVILTGMIAYLLHQSGQDDLQLIGEIPPGMPDFAVPPFSIPEIRNETTGEILQKGESFTEIVSGMGSSLIVIPLIALLENISVCKAFGKFQTLMKRKKPNSIEFLQSIIILFSLFPQTANGKSVDATQELLAIGASNVINSFVQGYPGTGSLSRGAVNNASGKLFFPQQKLFRNEIS